MSGAANEGGWSSSGSSWQYPWTGWWQSEDKQREERQKEGEEAIKDADDVQMVKWWNEAAPSISPDDPNLSLAAAATGAAVPWGKSRFKHEQEACDAAFTTVPPFGTAPPNAGVGGNPEVWAEPGTTDSEDKQSKP